MAAAGATGRFADDCRALTRTPHRLTGTPECAAAAEHVERRLRDIAPDEVLVQEFGTVRTEVKRCGIVVERPGGEVLVKTLLPARPNRIVPPVSPPGGIKGPLLYAGAGGADDFTASPEGRIVVLDYNCGRGWLRAFRQGARAVVFVAEGVAEARQALHSGTNANIPRFYYEGSVEDLAPGLAAASRAGQPDGYAGTIHSEVVWRPGVGRNIFAFLRGTDPVFQLEGGVEELIVLAANLDSYGEVPRASPGARAAANCAGLLRILEHLKLNRPRRHMLFAFLDAQARAHSGSCAFYRVFEEKSGDSVHIDKRSEFLKYEKEFVDGLKAALAEEKPWATESDVRRRLVTRLKEKAKNHVDDIDAILYDLRNARAELEDAHGRKEARGLPEYVGMLQREGELDAEKDEWNNLRRALHKKYITPGDRITIVADGAADLRNKEETSAASTDSAAVWEELTEDAIAWGYLVAGIIACVVGAGALAVAFTSLEAAAKKLILAAGGLAAAAELALLAVFLAGLAMGAATSDVPAIAGVTSDVSDEHDDGVSRLRRGDRLTVSFGAETNAPPVKTKAEIDGLLRFDDADKGEAKSPGADYTGEWTDAETLVITVRDDAGGTLALGDMPKRKIVLREVKRDVLARHEELKLEERALDCDRAVKKLLTDASDTMFRLILHVSLAFGDTSPRWGIIIGGDSILHSQKDDPGYYGKIQRAFLGAYDRIQRGDNTDSVGHFLRESADGSLSPPRVLWSAPYFFHGGEVAGRYGIYSIALGTCQENLSREGTPDDTLEMLGPRGIGRIERAATEAAALLAVAASEEGLSLRRAFGEDKLYFWPEFSADRRIGGPRVMAKTRGSALPNTHMPGAMVQVSISRSTRPHYQERKPYAFDNFFIDRTNQNGSYFFGPTPSNRWWEWHERPGFAAVFDEGGRAVYASNRYTAHRDRVTQRLHAFPCMQGAVVTTPQLEPRETKVLGAKSDFSLQEEKASYETFDGVTYWYCEERTEAVKLFGEKAVVGLRNADALAGTPAEGPGARRRRSEGARGKGFRLSRDWRMPDSVTLSAGDIWRLNEWRMEQLRSRGVLKRSLQDLHGRAEDLRLASEGDVPPAKKSALAASSFMMESSVYTEARATVDDLVHAVLVLLALSIPFAFAVERLVIGSTSIYRQIAWFAAFFVVTFFILFFSHPAFAISPAPMIIFLGFTVLVLSSLVIVIIMRKFETEIKVLQGMTSTVHTADVSRFNAMMAAMMMGISTMRRRPMRTALTATAIVMLTFTILCFASFERQTGIVKLFLVPPPGYTGVQIHQVNWRELNPDILDVLYGRWGGSASICARYWVSPENQRTQGVLVTREDGSRPVALRGVLGLEVEELRARGDVAELLGVADGDPAAGFDESVWITEAVGKRLKVKPGDTILAGGRLLRVRRFLDASGLASLQDMDGSGFLPVDFEEMRGMQQQAQLDEAALQMRQDWVVLPSDSVVIVSADAARHMGASLRLITIYTDDVGAATEAGEELTRILPIPVAVTRSDGVFRQILGSVLQAGGAKDLLFPVLLGGLVIFGTMLGSVADREKEIYTFSALGLAPAHVASLFLAEAMVYSVIGGLGGYLLAQGVMKALSIAAEFTRLRVPEMNYSSTNAITTLVIVMLTVLVSAIYPAMKASRSANPGILRQWRLPSPKRDTFDIVFPFTVSEYDITGVVSFLKEHFDNFTDTSLGVFMSKGARIIRGEKGSIGLGAELALAPFDLGVTQDFELRSTASEIEGIDEVEISITRKSGQPKDWARLNKVLLDDLRRQFLVWRSLPGETMEIYRRRTLTAIHDPAGLHRAGADVGLTGAAQAGAGGGGSATAGKPDEDAKADG